MADKIVRVESSMGDGFCVRCTAGGHQMLMDQPVAAGGSGMGPSPLEQLFGALAGCIGTIARLVAKQERIELRGMNIAVEGDLNTDGLLGKPTDDPVGFKEIRILAEIDADLTDEEKESFLHKVDQRCPVSFNLAHATPVNARVV